MRVPNLFLVVGVGLLIILAILGKSAVMAVSAIGIGLVLWITRKDSLRARLVAIVIGAVGGSVLAETIHTAYHLLGGETASGDSGFFYVSALLVGSINAVLMLGITGWVYWLESSRKAG